MAGEIICPNCGEKNYSTDPQCLSCGADLKSGPARPPQPPGGPPPPRAAGPPPPPRVGPPPPPRVGPPPPPGAPPPPAGPYGPPPPGPYGPPPPGGPGLPPRRAIDQGNWWDQQAASYADWMLWVHMCCCSCPGLIIGLLFVMLCKSSEGKQKGTQLIIYSSIGIAIGVVLNIISSALQLGQHGGVSP